MPELKSEGTGGGLQPGGSGGGGGGGSGGLGGGSAETNDAAQDVRQPDGGDVTAVQDEVTEDCGAVAEALAIENEALRDRVSELEAALAAVERRFELERALTDAGVIDLETALAVSESRLESGDEPASLVSELVSAKPFLFRVARPSVRGSASGGAAAAAGSSLSGLADEARKTGDRRALTRYLRKRRQG
ncbi:MAG: hypothetical protein AAGJ54_02525 [Planctomycetota bacterium]